MNKQESKQRIQQYTDALRTCLEQDSMEDLEETQQLRHKLIEAFFKQFGTELTDSDQSFFEDILQQDEQLASEITQKKKDYFESVKVQKRLQDGLSAYKLHSQNKQR